MGLRRRCPYVRFLGSYPRADAIPPTVHVGTADADFVSARTWLQAIRTGQATFPEVTGESIYEHLANNPEQGRLFDEAMQELTRVMVPDVLDAYDFSDVSRIVDIGGGSGALLSAILHREPGTSGVVFDAPRVADLARERIREEGLTDRCSVVGGDFFDEVPADMRLTSNAQFLERLQQLAADPEALAAARTEARAAYSALYGRYRTETMLEGMIGKAAAED